MKITLTRTTDCRNKFEQPDGSDFVFPGQDFEPLMGPTDNEKCNRLYVGPNIVDKLECESPPPDASRSSYIHVGAGRPPEDSPPPGGGGGTEPPVVVPVCDIRVSWDDYNATGHHATAEVANYGTQDVIFDAFVQSRCTVTPNVSVELKANEIKVLSIVDADGSEPMNTNLTVKTDKCGDFILAKPTRALQRPHNYAHL